MRTEIFDVILTQDRQAPTVIEAIQDPLQVVEDRVGFLDPHQALVPQDQCEVLVALDLQVLAVVVLDVAVDADNFTISQI